MAYSPDAHALSFPFPVSMHAADGCTPPSPDYTLIGQEDGLLRRGGSPLRLPTLVPMIRREQGVEEGDETIPRVERSRG